jgi:hypothetical protein
MSRLIEGNGITGQEHGTAIPLGNNGPDCLIKLYFFMFPLLSGHGAGVWASQVPQHIGNQRFGDRGGIDSRPGAYRSQVSEFPYMVIVAMGYKNMVNLL